MSITDYQSSLKNLIDATNDEATLKRWKALIEADLEQGGQTAVNNEEKSPLNESAGDKKEDTSGYVVIESGLGINE